VQSAFSVNRAVRASTGELALSGIIETIGGRRAATIETNATRSSAGWWSRWCKWNWGSKGGESIEAQALLGESASSSALRVMGDRCFLREKQCASRHYQVWHSSGTKPWRPQAKITSSIG